MVYFLTLPSRIVRAWAAVCPLASCRTLGLFPLVVDYKSRVLKHASRCLRSNPCLPDPSTFQAPRALGQKEHTWGTVWRSQEALPPRHGVGQGATLPGCEPQLCPLVLSVLWSSRWEHRRAVPPAPGLMRRQRAKATLPQECSGAVFMFSTNTRHTLCEPGAWISAVKTDFLPLPPKFLAS